MKLMHLSDLHIGKRVYEFSMLEDQKYILKQILEIAGRKKVDGVMIAGDIYDKPIPPAEGVQLFDSLLTKLADLGIAVFLISGNHDSAERIAFGAQLMSGRGIYVSPVYDGTVKKVCMQDEYGELWVYLLPFLKPAVVRRAHEAEIESYQDAVRTAVEHMEVDRTKRNVLIAHQFVTGAQLCESEEIQVGGLEQVDASVFEAFDYAALGHLHSPQTVGRETAAYCGTPLKYSFSEEKQKKAVTIVHFKEKGDIEIEKVPLVPLRDMRKIRGIYLEVTAQSFYAGTNTDDYIQVTLTDEEDIPDGIQKLRLIYPNLMRLEYDNKRTRERQKIERIEAVERKSELELFEELYKLQNNQPMNEEQKQYSVKMIRDLKEG